MHITVNTKTFFSLLTAKFPLGAFHIFVEIVPEILDFETIIARQTESVCENFPSVVLIHRLTLVHQSHLADFSRFQQNRFVCEEGILQHGTAEEGMKVVICDCGIEQRYQIKMGEDVAMQFRRQRRKQHAISGDTLWDASCHPLEGYQCRAANNDSLLEMYGSRDVVKGRENVVHRK